MGEPQTISKSANMKKGQIDKWTWPKRHKDRMKNLLSSGIESDLTVLVGSKEQKFKVHKIILMAGSEVLLRLIKEMKADKANAVQTLKFPDIEPQVFGMFLMHLYTGESGAEMTDALELLQVANDFKVQDLKDVCSKSLKGNLTDCNVLPLFQGAMKHAHKALIKSTLQYICHNAENIIEIREFEELRLECLMEIIKQDSLRVQNELKVFNAVLRWGEAECKRQGLESQDTKQFRSVLNKPLSHIRFSNMEQSEFAINVATKSLLNETELVSLVISFMVPSKDRTQLPAGRFISTPRNYIGEDITKSWPPTVKGAKQNKSRESSQPKVSCNVASFNIDDSLEYETNVTGVEPSEQETAEECGKPCYFTSRSENHLFTRVRNSEIKGEMLKFKISYPIGLKGFKFIDELLQPLKSYSSYEIQNFSDAKSTGLFVNITIKKVNKILLKDTKNFDFNIMFNETVKLKGNTIYDLEVEIFGTFLPSSKQLDGNINVGTGLKPKCDVISTDRGVTKIVQFVFSRDNFTSRLPINEGMIEELLFEFL